MSQEKNVMEEETVVEEETVLEEETIVDATNIKINGNMATYVVLVKSQLFSEEIWNFFAGKSPIESLISYSHFIIHRTRYKR